MNWPLLAPFAPPIHTLRHYSLAKLRKDLLAGLTVSVVEVPQAMAYAIIAGVPPVYGLYTSIIQGFIGALLSSSEHMTTGPTNTQSLLVASAIHRIVAPDAPPEQYLALVFALTALKGLIQLAFAAARMGHTVRYVSRSVIVGLVGGAGVLILFGQLPAFLGIASRPAHIWPGVIGGAQTLVHGANTVNPRALLVGTVALAVALAIRSVSKFLPSALCGTIAAGLLVFLMGWTPQHLPLIQPLPPSLPHFAVPALNWTTAEQLFGGGLALAIIGMLESVAIAKTIAARTGEAISPNQEFFAQGFKNLLSSFFSCIPGSGSFTRSALDYEAGAQTRFAAVFNSCFVAVIFLAAGSLAANISYSALAAILFVIAVGLIDFRTFIRLARTDRSDAAVCAATFCATLLLPLEYAIFTGIFLNIGLYLRRASKLHLHEMVQAPGGSFLEMPLHDRSGAKQVIFLQAEGDLFFGVADELHDRLTALTQTGVRVVVIRLKRMHSIDATALHVLETFAAAMREQKRFVILCGVKPELMRTLKGYGLVDLLGKDNVFATSGGVFESAKQALRRARQLAAASIDVKPVEARLADEAMDYAI